MPPAVGYAIGGIGAAFAAKSASKTAKKADATAGEALDYAKMPRFTNYGSKVQGQVDPTTGQMTYMLAGIDPRIRGLREQALQRLPGYRSALTDASGLVQSRLGATRDELASNENPFIQARVNPLMARAAEGRGQISRSLTRRGLGGSSLYSSGMGNYDAQVGREIGDQKALATNDALASRIGLDTQIYNSAVSSVQALQGLDQQEQSIAAQNLSEELSALGLQGVDINAILNAAGLSMQAGQLKNETYGRAFDSVGRMLGSMGAKSGGAV
jgi:hypothetical protein